MSCGRCSCRCRSLPRNHKKTSLNVYAFVACDSRQRAETQRTILLDRSRGCTRVCASICHRYGVDDTATAGNANDGLTPASSHIEQSRGIVYLFCVCVFILSTHTYADMGYYVYKIRVHSDERSTIRSSPRVLMAQFVEVVIASYAAMSAAMFI